MTTEPSRRISTLHVVFSLPPNLTTEQQKLLQRVTQDCPVKSNLDESIQIELHWT